MFGVHWMHYFTGCHPIEISSADRLSIAWHLDVDSRRAGPPNDNGICTWQIHSHTDSALAQNVCGRFIPRDQFRLLIGFIVKEQSEKENLIIGAWLRYAN